MLMKLAVSFVGDGIRSDYWKLCSIVASDTMSAHLKYEFGAASRKLNPLLISVLHAQRFLRRVAAPLIISVSSKNHIDVGISPQY
jgi:hypothetical protein